MLGTLQGCILGFFKQLRLGKEQPVRRDGNQLNLATNLDSLENGF
jgi:hypothetical protein